MVNHFTPKSDQYQISPAAAQEILEHTVWRTWLFISYSDERWYTTNSQYITLYISLLKGWENVLFELNGNAFPIRRRKTNPTRSVWSVPQLRWKSPSKRTSFPTSCLGTWPWGKRIVCWWTQPRMPRTSSSPCLWRRAAPKWNTPHGTWSTVTWWRTDQLGPTRLLSDCRWAGRVKHPRGKARNVVQPPNYCTILYTPYPGPRGFLNNPPRGKNWGREAH